MTEELEYIATYFDENDAMTDAIVNKLNKLADRVNLIDEDLDDVVTVVQKQQDAIIQLKNKK